MQRECRRQAIIPKLKFACFVVVSSIRILLGRTSSASPTRPTGRKSMVRTFLIAAACAAVLTVSPTAFAQGQFGTADEAKAMLLKAAAGVKSDKTKTLDLINKGEGGFLDRDLYPFCFELTDGKILAVASNNAKQFLGTDIRALKDGTGKVYGPDLYAAGQKPEGQISEVSYMFPRPGADKTPVQKVSFVTKAGDLACGVGHYK
jgi:hypothetical protein